MARDRSRSRDRDRKRARSNSRERRRSRSRERDRRHKEHRRKDADRGGDRDKDRDRRREREERNGGVESEGWQRELKEARHGDDSELTEEERKKKARLERLAAWKKQQGLEHLKQQECNPPAPQPPTEPTLPSASSSEPSKPEAKVWMPWEDPALVLGTAGQEAADPPSDAFAAPPAEVPPAQPVVPPAQAATTPAMPPAVPRDIQIRQLRAAAKLAEEKAREIAAAGEEDPLDAFMAAQILPEVKQAEAAEAARKEEERRQLAQQRAEGKAMPKLEDILEDSEEEPEPDAVMEVPLKKVKLIVGPGGERIKLIERKSKARLQILKEEEELNRAFGAGPKLPVPPKAAAAADGEEGPKMTRILLYGNANQCEVAQRMIEEAMDNKEQKAKQRHKEYERKREEKNRDRQMYIMRHTRDYEMLELPLGAARADVKAAYRKLAKLWHPDKHPENQEEAKLKFQKIQRAYDSLMLTEEDARIEALGQ